MMGKGKMMIAKKPIKAVGLMSGTSLDGVDAAQIITDGVSIYEFCESVYRTYRDDERAVLHAALGKWQDEPLDLARDIIHVAHAHAIDSLVGDLVGFHGQTLAHDPRGRGTHQLGDGQVLANMVGRPVVWDFRSDDVAWGGQGAPLAPFYHFACAKYIGATAPIGFLNLGGVGNVTFVDPRFDRPEDVGALLAFDTGPANAPINDLMRKRFGRDFDQDGIVARQGHVVDGALELFLRDPYFHKIPPKSLDRDAFAVMLELVNELNDADAIATLCAMVAASVSLGMDFAPAPVSRLLVTGGGRHNPVIMDMLAAGAGCPVDPVEAVGLDGDMLEAQAFAFLAVRVARGLPTSCPSTTGVRANIGGGIVSYPSG
jgi:anhydro-N-acetylmuramic acid kinase